MAASPPLTKDQSDALALLSDTLTQWGLAELAGDLKKLIVAGDTNADTLSLALSQTQAYKDRFAGNALRRANHLPELTPAQYIATEAQYKQVMQSYGLPRGFFDDRKDFTDLIGKDVSPAEVDARAKIAHDQYIAAPDYIKNEWQQYGFAKGDAIAAILDPNVATSIIQDRSTQVAIGGSAAAHGLSVDQSRAQQFQQAGVNGATADKAYQQIAQSLPLDQQIAQRFGQTFGQAQEENDLLLNDAKATQQRQSLYSEEESLFKGKNAADSNALGVSQSY